MHGRGASAGGRAHVASAPRDRPLGIAPASREARQAQVQDAPNFGACKRGARACAASRASSLAASAARTAVSSRRRPSAAAVAAASSATRPASASRASASEASAAASSAVRVSKTSLDFAIGRSARMPAGWQATGGAQCPHFEVHSDTHMCPTVIAHHATACTAAPDHSAPPHAHMRTPSRSRAARPCCRTGCPLAVVPVRAAAQREGRTHPSSAHARSRSVHRASASSRPPFSESRSAAVAAPSARAAVSSPSRAAHWPAGAATLCHTGAERAAGWRDDMRFYTLLPMRLRHAWARIRRRALG